MDIQSCRLLLAWEHPYASEYVSLERETPPNNAVTQRHFPTVVAMYTSEMIDYQTQHLVTQNFPILRNV